MNDKRNFVYYILWFLLFLLFVMALKQVEENDFRLFFVCVLSGACLCKVTKPKNEGNSDTSNPTNDDRKQNTRVLIWFCVIIACSIIGAIYRIFTTPLYTGANDIGVAGLGNLLYHPITHGPKGAIEGAIIGSVVVFAFGLINFSRNRKNPSYLQPSKTRVIELSNLTGEIILRKLNFFG